MSVVCRRADWADIPALLHVEYKTMPGHKYLAAVREKFLDPSQGVLLAAEVDGVVAGVAHLAFLSDGGSWFEVLRVTPDYQKRGCGTAMWAEAFKICEEKKLNSIRMYTGYKNVTSRKLAERFGLTLTCHTREGVLSLEDCPEEGTGAIKEFKRVTDPERAAELAAPYVENYGGYFCRNRTFWAMGPALWSELVKHGSLYEKDGSIVDIGARMELHKGFQMGLVGGDIKACADLAKDMLVYTGLPAVTAMIPATDEALKEGLEKEGFVFPDVSIIMLEKKFNW